MRVGVTEFKPYRLTQARESLPVTQSALAEMIGVTSATISKWESGKQFPEEKMLSVLSERTGYPVHWFTKVDVHFDENTPFFFRSNSRTTKGARAKAKVKLQWAAEISSLLLRWVKFPAVLLPIVEESNFLALSDHEIERAAIECRNLWRLGDLPIQDVVLAMESSGIIVVRSDLGETRMDGVSCWIGETPFVFISSDKANGIRNRFDAAHELGHLICHHSLSEEDYNNPDHYKEIERQANLFASSFLMPATRFAEDITLPTLDGLLAIKARWKVSVAAMIHRCHDLGIIDDDQKLKLHKSKSARGWSSREPKDSLPPELPRLLHRCIKMLVDRKVVSKQSLLSEIALPPQQIDKICGLGQYFSSTSDETPDNLVTLKVPSAPTQKRGAKATVVKFPQKLG